MKEVFEKLQEQMGKAIANLRTELTRVRTGRATPALLDGIKVDYYGSLMPISNVATVNCPESRLIQIQPWETQMLAEIEKAILKSELGLVPQNDGKIIRVPLPMLTEERRKELVKFIKKLGEEGKVTLRTERRSANDEIKKLEKDKTISIDESKKSMEQVQKKTDEFVLEVDKMISAKEKEIMSI